MTANQLLEGLHDGDHRSLSRCISIVENEGEDAGYILENLRIKSSCKVIGVTGPPGAGKSTLVNALLDFYSHRDPAIRMAVLAVDPTSPFTHGSLLGDRLRMNEHYENPGIFIRSLASRGALGGLSAKTIEITDVLKAAGFNYIFIETVGVGQSEVDVAALADTTLVVFVPESGDEIQTIKSGIMEIADIFVVNKSDREGADRLMKNLTTTLHERPAAGWNVPVVKTAAASKTGIAELAGQIDLHNAIPAGKGRKQSLLFTKALNLARYFQAKKIDINRLRNDLELAEKDPDFNIYRFISSQFS